MRLLRITFQSAKTINGNGKALQKDGYRNETKKIIFNDWCNTGFYRNSIFFSGCVTDFNGLFFGKEDTSVNWEMAAVDKVPSLNQLEKLSNLSKESSAIYRYADRAHAEGNKWYKFTAPEKEKEEYYAYKKTNGNSYIWEVYKKR